MPELWTLGIKRMTTQSQPTRATMAFFYFALSYCVLIPTLGTIVMLIVLMSANFPTPVCAWATCIYLSSVLLGLFSLVLVGRFSPNVSKWLPIVGIALSSVLAISAFVLWVACHFRFDMLMGGIKFEVRQNMLLIINSLQRIRHFCFDANPYAIGRRGLRRNRNVWAAASSDLSHLQLESTTPNTALEPTATAP